MIYCQRCDVHLGSRQKDYLCQLNKGLEDLWKIRASETRSKARGQTIARLDAHWAETVLRAFDLKGNSEPDENPLLSLAAGFGLNTYVHEAILDASQHSPELLKRDGPGLATRLSRWAIRDASQRELYTEMIEHLLAARFDVNTQHSSRHRGDGTTAWEDLVYLQPCVKDAVPFETWTELVEIFVRSGATLDVRLKHFKGAARRPTARELIVSKMEFSSFEKAPLEELVIMEKGKQRIGNLLTEIRVKVSRAPQKPASATTKLEDDDDTTPSLESPKDTSSHSPLYFSRNRRRTAGKRSKASSDPHVEAAPEATGICSRCQKIDALRDAGFDLDQIHQALDEKGTYCGISGLANTILSKKDDGSGSNPVPPTKAKPPVAKVDPPKRSTDSKERQWSVVTRTGKASGCSDVIGAQWAEKPKKERARRPKTLRVVAAENPCNNEHNHNADAIDMGGGTFTWFYEPKEKACSLTVEQKALLVDVIRNIIGA